MDPSDIALSFKNLGVSLLHPPKPIISNVSGYVKKGGITAVMGASASGKSVLMKVLSGRMQNVYITGEVVINGTPMDPYDVKNEVSYVPQDDFLQGELTARETLINNYMMKDSADLATIQSDVDELMQSFGIDHVADTMIGTVFVRGISGGQRKRVEICSELICPTAVLLLDEPTSGLDGAVAFEILSVIKKILKEKNGKLSVMITIHQPNTRILELFDHLLLLGGGTSDVGNGMLFFGTIPESIAYFSSLGHAPPEGYTPTDVFLQITDKNFGDNYNFDFEGTFACSNYAARLKTMIDEYCRAGRIQALAEVEADKGTAWKSLRFRDSGNIQKVHDVNGPIDSHDKKATKDSWQQFWRQYYVLVMRDFTLAKRDPSLYYLQFCLNCMFGFMTGAVFFQLKPRIDYRIMNIDSGLLWIVLCLVYLQVFKVYHLSVANARFKHEAANKTYSVLCYWLAELTVTSFGIFIVYIPGAILAYFMMGLPAKAFPFLLILFWLTAMTSESMLNVISKFSNITTVSIVSCQLYLVVLTVFGGGVFIPWRDTPVYWHWLQEISLYTQSTRSAIMDVSDYQDYKCTLTSGVCYFNGDNYPCNGGYISSTTCTVKGRTVLSILQGTIDDESKWVPFGWLAMMFAVSRLFLLLLLYYPPERIFFVIQDYISGKFSRVIVETMMGLRRVEGQFNSYLKQAGIIDGSLQSADIELGNGSSDQSNLLSMSQRLNSLRYTQSQIKYDTFFEDNPSHTNATMKRSDTPSLIWDKLSVVLPKSGKVLIDHVSGTAQSGRIVALMGPSGAGKTTLLNALGNRAAYAKVTGNVTFGDRSLTPHDLVYVPQFDEFNSSLTVYEQIEFVGKMKCADVKSMHHRLINLMRILGLSDRANTLCKDLTGGQLKRVSVGMGMISNPNVLFLDEPTTGLDSSAAYSIVKYIIELSQITKVVVILTIHQPAQTVFDMLQDLYLLELGRLAYFGPISVTKAYFAKLGCNLPAGINPADYFLDLVSKPPPESGGSEGTTWGDLYSRSVFAKNFNSALEASRSRVEGEENNDSFDYTVPPSFSYRFYTLCEMLFKYYFREIGFYYLRAIYLILVALFTGTIFLQLRANTNLVNQYSGAIFFSIWTVLFAAVAATGLMASDRRQAVEQVKNAVITPALYCTAQFVVSLPFNFVLALIFHTIVHWMVNLNPSGEPWIYGVLITTEHMLMMEAIMLIVVAVLKNAMLSVTFAMCVMGYLFLFPGFFILNKDMAVWIAWISWITPTFYSFEGFLFMIFKSQDFDVAHQTFSLTGRQVLRSYFGLYDINPWGMFGVMIAWILFFRFAHYAVFMYDVRDYMGKDNHQTVHHSNKDGHEKNGKGDSKLEMQKVDPV